jgi:hypothetical protein
MPFVTSQKVRLYERMWNASCESCSAAVASRTFSYYILSPTMLPNLPLACIGYAAHKGGVVAEAIYGVSREVNPAWRSHWVLFQYLQLQEGRTPQSALQTELLHLPGDCDIAVYFDDRITALGQFAENAPMHLFNKGEKEGLLACVVTLKARLRGANPPPPTPTLEPSFQPQPH